MPPIIRHINTCQQCRWHEYATTAALEQAATEAIVSASALAITQQGAFKIVLAGGTTPRKVYELLRTAATDWSKWHIYFGDERCLSAGHADRNSSMAAEAWLDHVSIPAGQIHIIPAEQGAEAAAQSYAKTLGSIDQFDLVILGLGEDGHTASLFPNHEWGTSADTPVTLAVHDAPKSPPQRVSLSAWRLSQTRKLVFLVTGTAKKQALQNWISGIQIPACAIVPACGVDIFLEKELLNSASN